MSCPSAGGRTSSAVPRVCETIRPGNSLWPPASTSLFTLPFTELLLYTRVFYLDCTRFRKLRHSHHSLHLKNSQFHTLRLPYMFHSLLRRELNWLSLLSLSLASNLSITSKSLMKFATFISWINVICASSIWHKTLTQTCQGLDFLPTTWSWKDLLGSSCWPMHVAHWQWHSCPGEDVGMTPTFHHCKCSLLYLCSAVAGKMVSWDQTGVLMCLQ
jgi:hypothetical protein